MTYNPLFCGWCLLQWAPTWQTTSAADAASLWYQHNLILKISLHSAAVCFAQSRFAWWVLFCIKHDIKVENSKLYYISVIFHSASKATAVPTWQGQWRHHRHIPQRWERPDIENERTILNHDQKLYLWLHLVCESDCSIFASLLSCHGDVKIRQLRVWSLQTREKKTRISSFHLFIIFSAACVTHILLLRHVCAPQERQIWLRQRKGTWTISWGIYRIQHCSASALRPLLKIRCWKSRTYPKKNSVLSWNGAGGAHFWVQNENQGLKTWYFSYMKRNSYFWFCHFHDKRSFF